jgi:hypothetical protein
MKKRLFRNKKARIISALLALGSAIIAYALSACDMTFVNTGSGESSGELDLEARGHYLKLVNMPLNTQAGNVTSAACENSEGPIAKIDKTAGVAVFKQESSANVYINLCYLNGAEFTEDGQFYITLAVFIDALTWINVPRSAGVLVEFENGRGTLDVLSLPAETISPNWPVEGGGGGDDKIKELEKTAAIFCFTISPQERKKTTFKTCG